MKPITRRTMIRRTVGAAAGAWVAAACGAGRGERANARPRAGRVFARVQVSADRVIRSMAGLRPFRPSGFVVRAEKLDHKTVVHNYGHGGGGISLSWGSAALARDLAVQTGRELYAVLGCGVMGLSTARLLQDRGHTVTIYAKDLPPNTTSNIAGAQWSPYTVSNPDRTTAEYQRQFETAARIAHRQFQNMIGDTYGVRWIENYSLTAAPQSRPQNPIGDLYFAGDTLGPGEHPFPSAYARRFVTMLVEPSVYLDALMRDFLLRGGRIVVREINDARELLDLPESTIVNCTGLGSRTLFGDEELIPIKGQLAILLPQPEVDYIVLRGDHYMFPRSDGIVLGGTRERGVWSTEPDASTIREIVQAHAELFEAMAD